MKLWYSFTKELKLSSKSFYFYIEIGMAIIFLVILLLVVPENFSNRTTEYVYLDLPTNMSDILLDKIITEDEDGKSEIVEIKSNGEVIITEYYETDGKKIYITKSREDVIQLAEDKNNLGAVISLDNNNEMFYEYFLQGYESEKIRNSYLVIHNENVDVLKKQMDAQKIVSLGTYKEKLSDRENSIPVFLTFNGSLMGLFIIASYIFLDKKEGIITAYAVTASAVWHYLLSKVGVLLVTTLITSLILIVPIMGLQPNYFALFIFLMTTGFFSSALGLVISSFFDDIISAFGVIYVFILVFMLPNVAYFMPSWEPSWIKFIPSYIFIQGFREIILPDGDISYVMTNSLLFLILGIALFMYGNYRFKKTLTV